MMIGIPFGWIIVLLVLLALAFLIFFFWLRRLRSLKLKKQRKKIRKDFPKLKKRRRTQTHPKDSKLLDRISERIKNAGEKGEKAVEINLEEGIELRAVASDLIELRTPRCILHKSFEEVRFDKIEKMEEGYKLHIQKS